MYRCTLVVVYKPLSLCKNSRSWFPNERWDRYGIILGESYYCHDCVKQRHTVFWYMHWERKNVISFRRESIYLGQSLHKEGLQDLYSPATWEKFRCVDIQFSLFTYCIHIIKPLNLQTRDPHSRQRILVSLTVKCGKQFMPSQVQINHPRVSYSTSSRSPYCPYWACSESCAVRFSARKCAEELFACYKNKPLLGCEAWVKSSLKPLSEIRILIFEIA